MLEGWKWGKFKAHEFSQACHMCKQALVYSDIIL